MSSAAIALALLAPGLVAAQNIAVVNGKSVPKARADTLLQQVQRQAQGSGQQLPPDLEKRVKDEVVLREIYVQEAEKRGLAASAEYRAQMDIARQGILLRELDNDFRKKNPVTEAEQRAEYDKFKAQAGSEKEYRARHILVEKEDEAKALIAQIKAGASFEDMAKKSSKDTGSAQNGGDLDWAQPGGFVPEFAKAMTSLAKGAMTETPVQTQFGWHILKLDDVRDAQFPPYDEVKTQIAQRLEQQKLVAFREELKNKAKTDYKFN
ncbi:MAG TPA: peptidylprolyl isomerase [Methylibium sp.]|nr:peptidylprolyl isomerase [Methylibium sp.]